MKQCNHGAIQLRSRCAKARLLLRRTNLSKSDIARKCDISPAAVSIMNKKYGIREVRQYTQIIS
jgi:predicted transcriptional regulator